MAIIDNRLLEPNGEPEITENFNRVLGFIDEGGGGGGGTGEAFIVTITATEDPQTEETTYTADKTPEEIYEAYDGGATVYVLCNGIRYLMSSATVETEGGVDTYLFDAHDTTVYAPESGQYVASMAIFGFNGTEWVFETYEAQSGGGGGGGLPSVTPSDAGKFLVVNSQGEWAATEVPIADNMTF